MKKNDFNDEDLSEEEELRGISILSEQALAKDWLSKEDNEAWKDL